MYYNNYREEMARVGNGPTRAVTPPGMMRLTSQSVSKTLPYFTV